MLPFDADAGIDGDDALLVGKEGIDVDLLDFCGETEKGGEADDDLSEFLFVDAFLSACAFDDLVATQRMDHRVGLAIGEGSET